MKVLPLLLAANPSPKPAAAPCLGVGRPATAGCAPLSDAQSLNYSQRSPTASQMHNLIIRPATPDDLAAINAIYNYYVAHSTYIKRSLICGMSAKNSTNGSMPSISNCSWPPDPSRSHPPSRPAGASDARSTPLRRRFRPIGP